MFLYFVVAKQESMSSKRTDGWTHERANILEFRIQETVLVLLWLLNPIGIEIGLILPSGDEMAEVMNWKVRVKILKIILYKGDIRSQQLLNVAAGK